jgi:hypothetical protein
MAHSESRRVARLADGAQQEDTLSAPAVGVDQRECHLVLGVRCEIYDAASEEPTTGHPVHV